MSENTELMEQTNPDTEVETETAEETDTMSNWDFGEDDAATDAEQAEEETDGEETNQQEQTNPDDEELFPGDFTVLGEARQVKMSEAPSLIQKGLAYDAMKEKYKGQLKDAWAEPSIAFVAELAKAAGKSPAEYIAAARNQQRYAELVEQYGDLSDVPDNVMQMFAENNKNAQDKLAKEMERLSQVQRNNELLEELETFRDNHPEVGEIPREVIELKTRGETLEGAFAIVELAKAQAQLAALTKENKILKQNSKNTRSSMPSGRNTAKKDDIMSRWSFD